MPSVSLNIGELDRQIRIETPTQSRGSMGGMATSWTLLDTVWAKKIDLRGNERLLAQQITTEAELKFRIRYRADFDETARVVDEAGKAFVILHIAEFGRRVGLDLLVKRPGAE